MTAILFDLDGTLIDASRDIHLCATVALRAEGLEPLPLETVTGFVGNGVDRLLSRCLAAHDVTDTPERHARMREVFMDCYVSAVEQTTVSPGAVTALEQLRGEGYRMAICTNKPQAPTRAVLDHLDLTRLFDAMTFGDGPYPRKPDPAAVRHLVDCLPARRVLYVGDSETDCETARNACVPMALYTLGHRKAPVEELYHDVAFDDFAQLPGIAARLCPRPE